MSIEINIEPIIREVTVDVVEVVRQTTIEVSKSVNIPAGGTTGQSLVKTSNGNFATAWETPAGGGDMLATVYDPNDVDADAFDMENMVEGAANKILTNINQTISGIKTFSSSPIIPAPSTDLQAATKKYVDDNSGGGAVDSVNTQTGVVVLDADDISDAATTNKYTTASEITKLGGIEALADVTDEGNVSITASVVANTAKTGITAQQTSDITTNNAKNTYPSADATKLSGIEALAEVNPTAAEIKTDYESNANTNAFTDTEKTNLGNQSNTNTGDQTSISGIAGTKSQYNTSLSDGNFLFEGEPYFLINDEADLDALIAGVTSGIWLFLSDVAITGNKVIPANVALKFINTKITGAFQITLAQTTIESNQQCFDGLGTFAGSIASNIRPEWFGAIIDDDTNDDGFAFQKAFEMADNFGGGSVEFSTGRYYIDSRISGKDYAIEVYSNTDAFGQGRFSTTVKVGDNLPSDTPLFLTNSASNVSFKNFEIDGNKSRLGTIAIGEDEGIDIKGGNNIAISDMYIHDMGTDAIDLDQVSNVGDTAIIENCIIIDCGGIGVHSNFFKTITDSCIVINCANERKANNTGQVSLDACGLDIKGAFSVISGCYLEDNARGINIAGIQNPIVIGNTLIDNGDENIVVGSVTATGGPQDSIISTNTMRLTLYGIRVKKSAGALSVYDNNVLTTGAGGIGFFVETCNSFDLKGGNYGDWYSAEIQSVDEISTISTTLTGSQAGIRLLTGASGKVVIKNCVDDITTGSGAVDIRGLVNGAQIKNNEFINRIGVRMLNSGGNPSNITVKDNTMTGMTVVGSGHVIQRNTGYVTENFGADTIANSSSTVVVSHGLSITPSNIVLTPAADDRIWYSTITSTQFTVNRAGTTGALNFSWEVK